MAPKAPPSNASSASGQTGQTETRPSISPSVDSRVRTFTLVARTPEEEEQFHLATERQIAHPSGVFASIAQIVKGALGAGILSSHYAYMEGGYVVALCLNVLMGLYMTYSLHILVKSAQILYRRCHVTYMSYPDLGEASLATHPNTKVQKFSKVFRYFIDSCICLDLFGSCVCYQLMVSETIKQLVENVQKTSVAGLKENYPNLRIYMLIMMIPFVCICLIRHLQWLAPFSIAGNIFVLICVGTTIYYSLMENPTFEGMTQYTTISGTFTFMGMVVFSMSCAGVVLPVENNMKEPYKFPRVLFIGMSIIIMSIMTTAFFGYNAYRDDCKSLITLNFPMETLPKILKVVIALNIYATHGINFYVPYVLTFHYLKRLHPPEKEVRWDYIYRTLISILITLTGIAFPDVPKVMNFLGCFCLSNMAFIWPSFIHVLVMWERPGLGFLKWRLIRAVILIVIGLILFTAGTVNSVADLVSLFSKTEESHSDDLEYAPEEEL